MLQTERADDPQESIRAALQGWQAGMWTAIPAVLKKFTADKLTCEAQPTIKAKVRAKTGELSDVQLPLCVDCPVVFPAGGGWILTFPLEDGDEGLLVFASRCIDAWWESGGVQNQSELRMHDLSDGFFIPGCFSKPEAPDDVSTSQVELRNSDNTVKLSTTETGFAIKGTLSVTEGIEVLNEGGGVEPFKIKGNIKQTDGGIETTGAVAADGDVTAQGKSLATHLHGGVQPGAGKTTGPENPP